MIPPSSLVLSSEGSLVDPRLRASNEALLRARVPRAGGRPGCPSLPLRARRAPGRSSSSFQSLNCSRWLNTCIILPKPDRRWLPHGVRSYPWERYCSCPFERL